MITQDRDQLRQRELVRPGAGDREEQILVFVPLAGETAYGDDGEDDG